MRGIQISGRNVASKRTQAITARLADHKNEKPHTLATLIAEGAMKHCA